MFAQIINRLGLVTRNQAAQLAQKAVQDKYPDWWLDMAGAHQFDVPAPENYEAQADLMQKVSYLYTVITLTAQSAASHDFDILDDGEEIENHPLEMLMKSPNPNQTGFEFLRDHFTYKLLNGGSYWWLNSTSEKEAPSEIWLIPPGNIYPVPDDKLGIKEYRYLPGDGQEIPLPTWQIVWFRGFHPSNQFASLSGLVPLSLAMRTDIQTQQYLSTVYGKNSGRLPGIIAFKSPVNDIDWRKIKEDVLKSANDKNYMMLRGVGDGVSWLQAASTINEMQTLQGRRMTKEDIYDTFAPGLLNMTSVNATEANATVGERVFNEKTLYPLFVDTHQKINKELAPRYGDKIKLLFDDPRDLSTRADAAKVALEQTRAGVFTQYTNKLPISLSAKLSGIELPWGLEYYQLDSVPQPAPVILPETTTQPALPAPVDSASVQADTIAGELLKWQRYEAKHWGKKYAEAEFDTHKIPAMLVLNIKSGLAACTDPASLPLVFLQAGQVIPSIILADAINKAA